MIHDLFILDNVIHIHNFLNKILFGVSPWSNHLSKMICSLAWSFKVQVPVWTLAFVVLTSKEL